MPEKEEHLYAAAVGNSKQVMKKTIGIIGGGFVGQILKRYYPEAKVYDINEKFDELEDVINKDIVFIAFNLRDNAIEGTTKIDDYLYHLKGDAIVVIKSTFVPGTTDKLQEKYPNLRIVYNPEFLTEMTAWEDFSHPQFQILGMPHSTLHLAHEIFELLPDAPVKRIISPLDAEMLKHAQNSYYALKVTWFNQLYDVCKEKGADYETLREIMVQNPWIGDSHSTIFHKGYRGYGGKCLSKDPKALSRVAKFPLIEHMEEYNDNLLGK